MQWFDTPLAGGILFSIKPLQTHVPGKERLERGLATGGLRLTRQREQIFEVVAESHDHPTAEEIFRRSQSRMPEISFATVYNSLSALVQCGLVRQVTLEKSPARFCPNMREHCHFLCESCGKVTDVPIPSKKGLVLSLPDGFQLSHVDVALRGTCSHCKSEPTRPRRSAPIDLPQKK